MAKRYTKKRIKKQMKKRKTGKLRYKKKRRGTSRRRYATRKKKGGASTLPPPPPPPSAAVVPPPSPPPAPRDCNTIDSEVVKLTEMLKILKAEKKSCIKNVYDPVTNVYDVMTRTPRDENLAPPPPHVPLGYPYPLSPFAPAVSTPVSTPKEREDRRNKQNVKVRGARTLPPGTRRGSSGVPPRPPLRLTSSPPSFLDGRADNTRITQEFNDRWSEYFL